MILTTVGHTAIAASLFNEAFFLAWGKLAQGQTPWTEFYPALDVNTVDMFNEVGRHTCTLKRYAYEDSNGSIVANNKTWSLTETPTRNIYLQFKFDASNSPTEVMYQLGLWMNSVIKTEKAEMTFQVVNGIGYDVDATQLHVLNLTGGTLADLLPVVTPNPESGGRKVALGDKFFRVMAIDEVGSNITVSPLPYAVTDGLTLTAPAITATAPGTVYLVPGDIQDKGTLFMAENIQPIYRNTATREMFEYVLTF